MSDRIDHPVILHADLDAFYASVEQRDNPALRNRPMMVGGGVVLAASYEARRVGVRTAMSSGQAKRLCPTIIEVPPRMAAYAEASRAVFDIFRQTTPEVEGLSIDEAFLDVTGLWRLVGPGRVVAERLRTRVLDDVGLPISVGCATTKFLAKVASAEAKPDGLLVVEPGTELDFLHPLPVERLWGVGPVTSDKLRSRGLVTVGDVASMPVDTLCHLLGRGAARHLHAIANNRDPRRVDTGRRRRSMGSQRSFPRGGLDADACDRVLLEVVDGVGSRLRAANRVGRTITVRFRFGDFTHATRSTTLAEATDSTQVILTAARRLLAGARARCEADGLTRLGVSVSSLGDADAVQLALPFAPGGPHGRQSRNLDRAVDDIRQRFGTASIDRMTLAGRSHESIPLLPDR